LVGDTTYSDYGLRIIRGDTGANATSKLQHRGTGQFELITVEASDMLFKTSSTERMRIKSTGEVGIGTTSPTQTLDVVGTITTSVTDTVQDVTKNAVLIQNDISGTGGTTGDRIKSALKLTSDNSATGSTIVSGQRLNSYGLYNTQVNTGDLYVHRGQYSVTTSGTAANTYYQYGIHNLSRTTSSGVITYNYGTVSDAQMYGSGDITQNIGSFNRAIWESTSSGNTASGIGAYNNIRTISGSTSTITAVRGTYTVIDHDDATMGTVYAHDSKIDVENAANVTGNAYMYYGIYSAGSTAKIVGTSWGVYLTGEDENYFSAPVGIGTTSPSTKLDVAGSVRSIPHNIGTLTAASTTINFDNGNHQYFTINTTSAFTFNNPSNADVGVIGTIRIERGASVPTDFLFGTAWKFPSPGTVPEIQSDLATSGDYGYLDYYVHGATDIRVTWSGKVGA
jgi:hypothetical protein